MPQKKNRGTEGRNEKVFSLKSAMHVPGTKPGYGTPIGVKPLPQMLKGEGSRKGGGKGIKSHEGYDVKTRMNLPSGKAMGESGRTQKHMKVK